MLVWNCETFSHNINMSLRHNMTDCRDAQRMREKQAAKAALKEAGESKNAVHSDG